MEECGVNEYGNEHRAQCACNLPPSLCTHPPVDPFWPMSSKKTGALVPAMHTLDVWNRSCTQEVMGTVIHS
jgi:hypothetical protein